MYKVLGSDKSLYEVYCHFDSDGAWTLVQSFSLANGSADTKFKQFRKPISSDDPVSENNLVWSGYRLQKARMQSIKENSTLLRFTCDYMKTHKVEKSDYLQISFQHVMDDLFGLRGNSATFIRRGIVGGKKLKNNCQFYLAQHHTSNLYASGFLFSCGITPLPQSSSCNSQSYYYVFGYYDGANACFEKAHRCVNNSGSTTQLWFG